MTDNSSEARRIAAHLLTNIDHDDVASFLDESTPPKVLEAVYAAVRQIGADLQDDEPEVTTEDFGEVSDQLDDANAAIERVRGLEHGIVWRDHYAWVRWTDVEDALEGEEDIR